MRIFIGVEPPDVWREALVAGCDTLRELDPRWSEDKWVPGENLHMTVKFMGDVGDDAVASLASDLTVALRGLRPFSLPVRDLLWPLGGVRKATMLWTTFHDAEGACAELVSNVEDLAADYGVVPDSRSFNPHITIVRTRWPQELRYKDEAVEAMRALLRGEDTMSVAGVTVFHSTLTKNRAFYKSIGSARLGD